MEAPPSTLRVDKWLWYARFFKTRSLAAKIVSNGAVRVDGLHIKKPSTTVAVGNTLTFVQQKDVRVVRVLDLGTRRGPAIEAQALYEDLTPPAKAPTKPHNSHPEAERTGRPTKKLRRDMIAAKRGS